jgi:hypothetical protein
MMRSFLSIIVIFGLSITIAYAQTNSWPKRIKSKTKHPLASFFSSCPNYINVLSIDGKRFENVRGVKQFYLTVPGTHTICFVTDERGGTVNYHLFNMDTIEDVVIPAQSSSFGRSIGATDCSDIIEGSKNGDITLSNIDRDAKSTIPELADLSTVKWICVLNTPSRKILSQKTLYFDRQGKLLLERDDPP